MAMVGNPKFSAACRRIAVAFDIVSLLCMPDSHAQRALLLPSHKGRFL
jgi:hypothetical protein